MAISRLQTKLIGAAGPAVGQAVGSMIATKPSEADKYNQDRIAELQRMQELGSLGLTEQEKRTLQDKYSFKLGQIGQEGAQRRSQQMASFDMRGGQALQQAALTDKALIEGTLQAEANVLEADMARRAQLEAELARRQAVEDKRIEDRRLGIGKAVAGGIEALSTIPSEDIEEQGQISKELINAAASKLNMSPKQAEDLLKQISGDPILAKLLGGAL